MFRCAKRSRIIELRFVYTRCVFIAVSSIPQQLKVLTHNKLSTPAEEQHASKYLLKPGPVLQERVQCHLTAPWQTNESLPTGEVSLPCHHHLDRVKEERCFCRKNVRRALKKLNLKRETWRSFVGKWRMTPLPRAPFEELSPESCRMPSC